MTARTMRYGALMLVGGLAMAALPAFAAVMAPGEVFALSNRPELSLPAPLPLNGTRPPRFEREGWARGQLADHGLHDIRGLARVGDYWEAEARAQGRPVVVYLQDDGTLTFQHASRAKAEATFGSMPTRG